MARSLADGVHGGRRAADLQRGLQRQVIQAGRDERTLLRLSRISIARCADLIRSSAYAWGPLSWSVHPVTAARATDQRPCARDLRPDGAGSTAGLRWREMADASWPSWRSRLLMPVTCCPGIRRGRQVVRHLSGRDQRPSGSGCLSPAGARCSSSRPPRTGRTARSGRSATRGPHQAGPVRSRHGGLLRSAQRTAAWCFAGRGRCARAGTARVIPTDLRPKAGSSIRRASLWKGGSEVIGGEMSMGAGRSSGPGRRSLATTEREVKCPVS